MRRTWNRFIYWLISRMASRQMTAVKQPIKNEPMDRSGSVYRSPSLVVESSGHTEPLPVRAEIANLKSRLVKTISEFEKPNVPEFNSNELEECFQMLVANLPAKVESEFMENSKATTIYFFARDFNSSKYFRRVSEEQHKEAYRLMIPFLIKKIKENGIPFKEPISGCIDFNIEELKSFCNYDKVKSLV